MKWDEKRSKLVDLSQILSSKCQKRNIIRLFPGKIFYFVSLFSLQSPTLDTDSSIQDNTILSERQSSVINLVWSKKKGK